VAGVVSFMLIGRSHSPGAPVTSHSSALAGSPSQTSTPRGVSPPQYTHVPIQLSAAYKGVLSSMAFSPGGATLAIAGGAGAGEACLWNIAAGRCTANLPVAHSVAFSPDGTILAATDSDSATAGGSTIRLWEVATGTLIRTLIDPGSQGGYSVAFGSGGTILAVADADGSTYLWHVVAKAGKLVVKTDVTSIVNTDHAGFTAVAYSSDGTTLATGDVAGNIILVNVATKTVIFRGAVTVVPATATASTATDPSYPMIINSVAFSPDGATLAIGDLDGSTYLMDVATGKQIGVLPDPGRKGVDSVAFSHDGDTLAVGDANGRTYLWDVATQGVIAVLTDPGSGGVTSVAFSPDDQILATGDEDGSANLWRGKFRLSIPVVDELRGLALIGSCHQSVTFAERSQI
jgi:WD40 repeat protein